MKEIVDAKKYFEFIIKNYPDTEYAYDSKFKLELIVEIMASKEMYLARYYVEREKWIPAINRFKKVVNEYDKTIYVEEAIKNHPRTKLILNLVKKYFKESRKILILSDRREHLNLMERYIQLSAVEYVDEIIPYSTERDLLDLLTHLPIDIRILGEDHKNKDFTGKELGHHQVYFNKRRHRFSTTNLRKAVTDKNFRLSKWEDITDD